jgi:putative colanic acid biosynthesis acetyltransferase WcaF
LQTAKITIGPGAFVCARAFIMPGVVVGARAIVGACAVVTRDVAPGMIVAGNPAREIGRNVTASA